MPTFKRVLSKFPEINALITVAADAMRTMSPRATVDLAERTSIEESGDVWGTLTKTQRIACFLVVDARECIEMGIKGLGEARTVDVTSQDVVNASIRLRVTSGPGVPIELVVTLEGFDADRTSAAMGAFERALGHM